MRHLDIDRSQPIAFLAKRRKCALRAFPNLETLINNKSILLTRIPRIYYLFRKHYITLHFSLNRIVILLLEWFTIYCSSSSLSLSFWIWSLVLSSIHLLTSGVKNKLKKKYWRTVASYVVSYQASFTLEKNKRVKIKLKYYKTYPMSLCFDWFDTKRTISIPSWLALI